ADGGCSACAFAGTLRSSVSGVPPFDPVDRPLASGEDTAEVPPVASPTVESAAWHTTELPRSPGVVLPPGLWLVFLFVAATGLLIGIAFAAATRPGSPGAVVASATIGPDGGTLSFGTHGLVRVPDGAVTAPIRIEVRRSVVKDRLRVSPPDGPLYVFEPNRLVAYMFAPSSVTFAQPVTIV